jgi:hypothetical protein
MLCQEAWLRVLSPLFYWAYSFNSHIAGRSLDSWVPKTTDLKQAADAAEIECQMIRKYSILHFDFSSDQIHKYTQRQRELELELKLEPHNLLQEFYYIM